MAGRGVLRIQHDARRLDGQKNVKLGNGNVRMKGVEEPICYWVPSIALSGMTFYTGDQFPEWRATCSSARWRGSTWSAWS
jgi:glucose/arabinose dehydrogenase